jgi:small nuclear ribonucleoprotein (snRNP)-like protein
LETVKESDYSLQNISVRKITLLVVIISLSLYTSSAYAPQGMVSPYFTVQVPSGWVYKEHFLSDSNTILTANGFANLLNVSKPSQSLLDLVQKGVLLELGTDEHFRADNISLEKYVKYFLTNANEDDVTVQNASIGGERAIRIFINGTEIGKTSPMKNVTGSINSLGYLFLHRGEPYYIYYIANEKNFMDYISDFEQIAKTFNFLK